MDMEQQSGGIQSDMVKPRKLIDMEHQRGGIQPDMVKPVVFSKNSHWSSLAQSQTLALIPP